MLINLEKLLLIFFKLLDTFGKDFIFLILTAFKNYESLRVVPSLNAKTPANITIKKVIPARSGEFMPRPEEKSTLDKSKVL